ncbi:diaminopimelate epimerase [Salisaeta longa]|uniref:diaminopimelate epimerase n=1 Tax=Salisaeta longa TaxID=503170 RepID=UPI0003B559E0|nr:diaminopimelate epimerase [Salisaeta longa]
MARSLTVTFSKMQGAGNDFVVLDNRFYRFAPEELSDLAARWCPRRTGIGADGLLAFEDGSTTDLDFRMRYYNADGSRATMCGNGARCLARFARDAGLERPVLRFATDAGTYRAAVPNDPTAPVRLYVPSPERYASPVDLQAPPATLPAAHFLWTGTEHVVLFVDDVEAAPLADWGPAVRGDEALQPEGANVNLVEVRGPAALAVRTYEKGVEDETLACGTGVLAAALVARRQKRVDTAQPTTVHTRGGALHVGTDDTGLYLSGAATFVFRGTVTY